jgi:hypothetical protein
MDGSSYLSSLKEDDIDVLIIDADDGSAPPLSMRGENGIGLKEHGRQLSHTTH